MWIWLSFALIGCLAGMSAGLLGLGGGLIIVPTLLLVFHLQGLPAEQLVHIAIATSLMTITVTALSSTFAHHRQQNINWSAVKQLTPGLVLGGIVGAYLATSIEGALLQRCFAVYALVVALRMWFPMTVAVDESLLKTVKVGAAGIVIGIISAIVGIGGGSLTVPYLVMAKQSMTKAVGTAAACGFPISVAAELGFIAFGQNNATINDNWLMGAVHWQAFLGIIATSIIFAPLGAKLATRLPVKVLRQLFSIALLLVALSLFITN